MLGQVRSLKTWPVVPVEEWRQLYWLRYKRELETSDFVYKRIRAAIKVGQRNVKRQDDLRQNEKVAAVRAAAEANPGKEQAAKKALAVSEVQRRHL